MSISWYETFFDHFAKFLKNPVDRYLFKPSEDGLALYIPIYDKVFKDCRVFCSIGLSHYADAIGKIAEIWVPVDAGWTEVPEILANTLFHTIAHGVHLDKGTAISLQSVDLPFSEKYAKTALYFTVPYGLPQDFEDVEREGVHGEVYLAFFISEAEFAFLQTHTVTQFEELLEMRDVDPFHLERQSCI